MLLIALLASLFIAGCGSSGKSAEAPTAGMTLVPGDGIITASWAMSPGVDYWLFYAPSASITTSNWANIPGSQSLINVGSPHLVTGLVNGIVYSFTVNGRTNGGPGGDGTPSVSAIPRLAGTATSILTAPWTAGTALGANDLLGLTYGSTLVAVGAGGVVYSSPDGVAWTRNTSAAVSANVNKLNAASYSGNYYAVGDGGVILYSADAITWTAAVSSGMAPANKLNAVTAVPGRVVAVGAGGRIITSTDGTNWTAAANSGTVTTNDLYAVTFNGTQWIAVGAQGTVLTSTDGTANTWTLLRSNAAFDQLKGITIGTNATTGAVVYVAVGANGALVTSPDAATWTAQTAIGTGTLNAVTAVTNGITQGSGTQFVAVGANGIIYTSIDAATWTAQPSTTVSNLNAVVHFGYDYEVVGAAGVNLLAK
jgi:hypothetical protein